MINLHVFWSFDFRPIFGGFLKGLGTSKLVIFSLFSHFLPCKFRSLFFGQQQTWFLKKGFLFWARWAVRADPVSKA